MKFECNCTSPESLRELWENTRSAHTGFAFEVAARLWYTPDGWNRSIMVEYQITTASGREMAENPDEPDYFTAYEVENENDADCSVEIASTEISAPVGFHSLSCYMRDFVKEIITEYEMRKSPPQIDKVLTISSSHITLDTSGKLDVEPAFCPIDLSIFPKQDCGWWIFVEPCIVEDSDIRSTIPEDLMDCIRYAWKHNCTWLCLDCYGETRPELKIYNWEE